MPSQGGSHKRSRGTKGQDDDPYLRPREEDPPSDSYSRSQHSSHRSEAYRPSSRAPYESSRDIPDSRSRYEEENWRHRDEPVTDRYYNQAYRRGERDEYDYPAARESETWRSSSNGRHSHSRQSYPHSYDREEPPLPLPPPPYRDSTTWNSVLPVPYEDPRSAYYDEWSTRDIPPEPVLDSRSEKEERAAWSRDPPREKRSQRFQRDLGWDNHRREKVLEERERRDEPSPSKVQAPIEDRSWEPAASWKSSTREQQSYRGQNGQRNNNSKHKVKKRGQETSKQRRDWRDDDNGGLNNWTRRDTYSSAKKTASESSRRKYHRSSSRSRSRSRSPAGSYLSRRSSRGRSRSRSLSPPLKRRRRQDSDSAAVQSHPPSDRDIQGWVPRYEQERQHLRSRSPYQTHGDTRSSRPRSISSVSSNSSEHSVNNDPDRPRAVHRLPTVTAPVTTPSVPFIHGSRAGYSNSGNGNYQNGASQRNGRYKKFQGNGKHYNNLHNQPEPVEFVHHPPREYEDMPPPSSIPSSHYNRSHMPEPEPFVESERQGEFSSGRTATRVVSSKNARFKPIGPPTIVPKVAGRQSSELKRFFPGDDDEMDHIPDESVSNSGRSAMRISPTEDVRRRSWEEDEHFQDTDDRRDKIWPEWDDGRNGEHRDHHFDDLPSSSGPSPLHLPPPPSSDRQAPHSRPVPTDFDDNQPSPLSFIPQETLVPTSASQPQDVPHTNVLDAEDHNATASSLETSSKDLYSIISQVGEGTFGKVYKARNTITNVYVALKRIRMESERDGFPVTAMREIKLLQSLRHPNVVRLYEMMVSSGSVYMVFEYMDHDLTGVLSQTQLSFTPSHLKSLCHQMLAGLAYLHHKGVIHRDIKGSNILINNRGELKLGDFGLARFYQKRRRTDYTNRVITLWYRPPELLLGATVYGPEVDMWSAGCIMLELFTKKPVFQGVDEINQLEVVYKIIGTPTTERWHGVMNLPWYELVKPVEEIPNKFRELFRKWMSPAALDLAEQLLAYDPSQRVNAVQAMEAPYFTQEEPPAEPPIGLATLEGEWHEYETKRERERKKHQQRKKAEGAA